MNRRTYPFLVADTQLYKRLCPSVGPSVGPSIGPSVMVIELKIGKTDIFAPAHPSATGGRVSGLDFLCNTLQLLDRNTFVEVH